MATLPTRSFSTIVSNIAAGMQGRVSSFLNFALGSVFRAVAESVAGNSLWLQGMILQQVKLTRLSTSYGADADSWVADWNLIERMGAVPASGLVVFSRYTASGATPIIPVGARVQTIDGTQAYAVTADTTNPAFSVVSNGYVLPAQISNIAVPVVSITPSTTNASGKPGANGNVPAGAIARLGSSIPGIDTVINPADFANGEDEESDPDFKQRFQDAVQTIARATPDAIKFSIESIQQGLQVKVLDGYDYDLAIDNGMTSVIVDDGTGALPDTVLQAAMTEANLYRASGTRLAVYKALATYATIQLVLTIKQGYQRQLVAAQLVATISGNINGLGLGNELDYFTVAAWAMTVPGVAKIDNLTINDLAADIAADPRYTVKCSGVTVN